MKGMYVSVETIATIISGLALLVSFFAAFGWLIHRTDSRIDAAEGKLGTRIDAAETKLEARIDDVETKLEGRINALETKLEGRIDALDTKLEARTNALAHEVVEVKIAVARLEGPPRRLLPAR